MNNNYKERIIITRTSENHIEIDSKARIITIERAIIGLFELLNRSSNMLAIELLPELIEIAARKES